MLAQLENPRRSTATRNRPVRHGLTMIILIAFFAVSTTMLSVWLRSAVDHRRQMVRWHRRSQASWLADAGVRRAAARLLREGSEYQGEHWRIDSAELGGRFAAEVVIRIEFDDQIDEIVAEPTKRLRIIATADYPADSELRARSTKSVAFQLPDENSPLPGEP